MFTVPVGVLMVAIGSWFVGVGVGVVGFVGVGVGAVGIP